MYHAAGRDHRYIPVGFIVSFPAYSVVIFAVKCATSSISVILFAVKVSVNILFVMVYYYAQVYSVHIQRRSGVTRSIPFLRMGLTITPKHFVIKYLSTVASFHSVNER